MEDFVKKGKKKNRKMRKGKKKKGEKHKERFFSITQRKGDNCHDAISF